METTITRHQRLAKLLILGSVALGYSLLLGVAEAAVSVSMSADPANATPAAAGQPAAVTVSWNAADASGCTRLIATSEGVTRTLFNNANEPAIDSYNDQISGDTTYTLTCVNTATNETDTDSDSVIFTPFGPPQITDFSFQNGVSSGQWDPTDAGVSVRVDFDSVNADKCERYATDVNGVEYTLTGWTARDLSSTATNWTDMGTQVVISDDTTFHLRCGRTSSDTWTSWQTIAFDVTGTAGGATTPTASLVVAGSVSVSQASDLPATVSVQTSATDTNSCTYTARSVSSGSPISVPGWTNRASTYYNQDDTFDIQLSEPTELTLTCTRSSDGVDAVATQTTTINVTSGGAPALTIYATDAGMISGSPNVNVHWVGENVNSCYSDDIEISSSVVGNWYTSGAVPFSGIETTEITDETTYRLTCENTATGATVTEDVTVPVDGSDNPVFASAPTTPPAGSTVYTSTCPWSGPDVISYMGGGLHTRGLPTNPYTTHRHTYPESNGTIPLATPLAAGTYRVSLYGHDDSVHRLDQCWTGSPICGTPQNQENEEYHIEFLNSANNVIASSDDTPDLDDTATPVSWYGEVNSSLTLPEDVHAVRLRLSQTATDLFHPTNYDWRDDNSIDLGCALVESVGPPPAPGAPSVSVFVNPDTLPAAGNTVVSWTSANADTCTASSNPAGVWSGSKSVNGTFNEQVAVTTDTTFTLTCTNSSGSNDASDTVVISPAGPALLPNIANPDVDTTSVGSWSGNPITGTYDNVNIDGSVQNTGAAVITDAFDSFFSIDFDDDWDVYGVLPDVEVIEGYGAGIAIGARSGDINVELNGVPFGTHEIYFYADSDDDLLGDVGSIPEENESDNGLSSPFTFVVPIPPPPMTLTVDRDLVQAGDSVNVSWDVNVAYPLDCELFGPGVTGLHDFTTAMGGTGGSGTTASGQLQNSTTFAFRCTEDNIMSPATVFEVTAEVEVIPEFQES